MKNELWSRTILIFSAKERIANVIDSCLIMRVYLPVYILEDALGRAIP